ncbi:hypothetical protein P168DRAFT_86407 [Aspergillus campestris IBT 28561]|uniref:Uncharacterized protein n=1 Tax=Aspergillus campestris (strain IBT 28561) TaxID=1392248 RepID=A0A2I1DAX7_ASPC2|nr:uncharacterized protein P168DRAFT_86407 [Aspergillus campestris IBT 28561]PKY07022.1 hypothetical protein P168DRAFT_86407 [Aspergillus campestris IBT 28561]
MAPPYSFKDIFPDPDRSPLSLDEATRALYRRAIEDPTSLTDEERRIVTHRPPRPEEDEHCRNACGLSHPELVRKCIDHADNLSYKETSLILAGVVPWEAGKQLSYRVRLSGADRDLLHKAAAAAWTEELKAARANAMPVQRWWLRAHVEAGNYLNDDDIRHSLFAMKVPWQEHVLNQPGTVCGLVVFYPTVPEWPPYQEEIETAIYHGLHYPMEEIEDAVLAKFTLHWVQHDSNNTDDLQTTFVSKRDSGELPRGLRTDAFLYVDHEALQSRGSRRPFVWLWEPKRTTEEDPGPLRIDIKHIAPTLFARLPQRDFSPGEEQWKPYRRGSNLPILHHVTQYSKNLTTLVKDGIWPPPARAM